MLSVRGFGGLSGTGGFNGFTPGRLSSASMSNLSSAAPISSGMDNGDAINKLI